MAHFPVKKVLLLILLLGFILRFFSIWPTNIILGFDQARDLFSAKEIISGDLKIIGPTAGNNPNLHHGVAWLYFLIPPLLLGGNPMYPALWNSLFNLFGVFVIYLLAKELFDEKTALISAFLGAVSFSLIEFSGWLSNPSPTIFTVPLFMLGIAKYSKGKSFGLHLAALALGASIQFELFFLYLIPLFIILFFVLKLKLPSLKIFLLSLMALAFSLSTMIATEIKFGFSGVKSLLTAGQMVGGAQRINFVGQFANKFAKMFSSTLFPEVLFLGAFAAILTIAFLIYKKQWFVLIYLLSPVLMLALGYHNAPWFLIGLPPAIILSTGFILSRIKSNLILVSILIIIGVLNIKVLNNTQGKGQPLLEPDQSSILLNQIAVMDYTYQKAQGQPFAINTVTNPLYINAVFAWNYDWHSNKYNYKPSWLGGDQLPPYNTLPKATGKEKYFFLIIDETPRIPEIHKILAVNWAKEKGKMIEEKEFQGWKVSMWQSK